MIGLVLFSFLVYGLFVSMFILRWQTGLGDFIKSRNKQEVVKQIEQQTNDKKRNIAVVAATVVSLAVAVCNGLLLWVGMDFSWMKGGAMIFLFLTTVAFCLIFSTFLQWFFKLFKL